MSQTVILGAVAAILLLYVVSVYNRLVLHQAFDDYGDHRREMYRSTVLGEVPA